jgi:hypothetical protein
MTETITQIANLAQPVDAYIIIAPLSGDNRRRIVQVQNKLADRFGAENLWLPTADQLHITFAHITTPGVNYGEAGSAIFDRVGPDAIKALARIAPTPLGLTSRFDTIEAFAPAIIIKGHDDGSFDRLRQEFSTEFTPPEGTRTPPAIIHATIARFLVSLNLAEVQAFTAELMAAFKPFEVVTNQLELIHEQAVFTQHYEVLEHFPDI